MNKIILIGRLAADPEIRHTTGGNPVANFRIAVRRVRKQEGGPEADFFTVIAWNRLAEVVRDYCSKGRQVAVSGRLQNRSWEGQDGKTRHVTEIIAEEIDLLALPATGSVPQEKAQPAEQEAAGFSSIGNDVPFPFEQFDEDELPF